MECFTYTGDKSSVLPKRKGNELWDRRPSLSACFWLLPLREAGEGSCKGM